MVSLGGWHAHVFVGVSGRSLTDVMCSTPPKVGDHPLLLSPPDMPTKTWAGHPPNLGRIGRVVRRSGCGVGTGEGRGYPEHSAARGIILAAAVDARIHDSPALAIPHHGKSARNRQYAWRARRIPLINRMGSCRDLVVNASLLLYFRKAGEPCTNHYGRHRQTPARRS